MITTPDTPLPWINYLGCEAYFGIISNTAGGYSFYRDARMRRLTRYRYNNAPFDLGGRYLYIRDNESGKFWSPSWQPTQSDLDKYECRHGLGYTTISSTSNRIEAETCYFVPLGENLEIWRFRVTNRRRKPAKLSVFSSIEFCLWDAQDDATNFQRNFSIGQVEIEDGVIYHKTEYRERRDHFAYFACSAKLAGFDTQRDVFLGPYRGWDNPAAVERGRSFNSVAHGWAPHRLASRQSEPQAGRNQGNHLRSGLSGKSGGRKIRSARFANHQQTDGQAAYRQISATAKMWRRPFKTLREYWDGLLGIYQVKSPDLHANRMVNIWNAYQCMATFNVSRSASFYESGIGRGLGFRDSNQDLLGFVHMVPARARERILDLAATQLKTGGAFHQYQPLTKRGNNDIGSGFNDDPHWLILGVAAYIKETGDWGILDEPVQFENEPGSEQPLYEHLRRSFNYTLERIGPHGLPLIGRADWNDCLNLNCFSDTPGPIVPDHDQQGRQGGRVGLHRRPVRAGREGVGRHCQRSATATTKPNDAWPRPPKWKRSFTSTAGTAQWFVRAYDDFGKPVGSKECDEGKIFIESQGMCVMAGIGLEDGKAKQALDSVNKHLATEHGIVLQQPALLEILLAPGRNLLVSAGLQGERGHLLPQQSLDHHCRDDRRQRRPRLRLLTPALIRRRARRSAIAPLRALRLRADDGRQGRPHPWRSQELLAYRHRRLDLLDRHAMDSRHPPRIRRLGSIPAFPRNGTASLCKENSETPRTKSP